MRDMTRASRAALNVQTMLQPRSRAINRSRWSAHYEPKGTKNFELKEVDHFPLPEGKVEFGNGTRARKTHKGPHLDFPPVLQRVDAYRGNTSGASYLRNNHGHHCHSNS